MNTNKCLTIMYYECFTCRKTFHFQSGTWINQICKECGESVEINPLNNPIKAPNRLSIIITLSYGDLSPDTYSMNDILHVGISNSKLNIYNFWNTYKIDIPSQGIWKNVINIPLETSLSDEDFDSALEVTFSYQQIDFGEYLQFSNNCFDFVARFLTQILYLRSEWTKENLASNIVQTYILELERYSLVYQKLMTTQYYITNISALNMTYSICDICSQSINFSEKYRCKICKDFDLCPSCFKAKGHEHEMIIIN